MALSGSFSQYPVTADYGNFGLYCEWSGTQNTIKNSTTITLKVYLRYWALDVGARSDSTVSINGTSETYTVAAISHYPNSDYYRHIKTYTVEVPHDDNGAKTCTLSASWRMSGTYDGTWVGTITASTTVTLDTIARQATITSAPDFNDEQNPTITYSNPAGNRVTSLSACISFDGSAADISYRDISKTDSSYTFNLTEAERKILRDSIPNSNTRNVLFYVRTVISGETYYSFLKKTLTIVNGNPTFSSSNLGYYDSSSVASITGNSAIIVRNKSNLMVTYTAATAKKGATISQYSFTVNGVTKTSTSAGGSINFGTINSSNNLTLSATVTDSRGNVSSTVTKTITCYDYYTPSFTSFNAYRSDANGTANLNGTYIKWDYGIKYASVNGKNAYTVKIYGVPNGAGSVTSSGAKCAANDSKTYNVYAIVSDSFGGSNQSATDVVYGPVRILNISQDGSNVAVGKTLQEYDKDGVFDCRWKIKTGDPANTMKNLSYRGMDLINSTTNDTTTLWGEQGNLAMTFYTKTGQITDQPSQYGLLLNLTPGPNNSEVHQLWATQSSGNMLHRGGNSNGWNGTWRTILDSSNYTSWTSTKPTTLYSTSTGNIGTITLSESAANFTYLEIFYTDNNNRQPNSVKVYSPNGKYVSLSCIEPSTTNTTPRIYIRSSGWTISGTSMTVGRSDSGQNDAHRGIYGQLYPGAGGTNVDINVTKNNYIKIFRVLGYK